MSSFAGKTVVVTGGTGSFGSKMVRYLLSKDVQEIRIFSRDELKQDNLRRELADSRLNFILGDTRNPESMRHLFRGANHVFHAAALKQVPSGEFFPMELVKTNIEGSSNVIRAAEEDGVESLVVLSTDKAVYPINAMGMSKALMEKVAVAEARRIGSEGMKVCVTRYGNVMMSRGSVIPAFLKSAEEHGTVQITDSAMTRFMMSLADSVELVEHALLNGNQGGLYVRKSPGATLATLHKAIEVILNKQIQVNLIGVRHGEKMHETLVSAEEMARAKDLGQYFGIPMDDRDLDYKTYFEKGEAGLLGEVVPYTSSSTEQLDASELAELISSLPEFGQV